MPSTFNVGPTASAGPAHLNATMPQQAFNSGGTGQAPVWGSWSLAAGTVGIAYDEQWFLEGCALPTTYLLVSGALPPGLALANLAGGAAAGGHISGTPTTAGTYAFTVRATNAYGTADKALSITINPAPASNYGWVA